MKTTLLQSNVWLKNEAKRDAALRRTAATSSAIEGIFKPFASTQETKPPRGRATSARARG